MYKAGPGRFHVPQFARFVMPGDEIINMDLGMAWEKDSFPTREPWNQIVRPSAGTCDDGLPDQQGPAPAPAVRNITPAGSVAEQQRRRLPLACPVIAS